MLHTHRGIVVLLCACGDPSSSQPPQPDARPPSSMVDADTTPDAELPPPPPPIRFASEAMTFGVTTNGVPEGFSRPDALLSGTRHWVTLDLDHDGKLDLVHTGDTAIADKVWDAAGTPYWKVFR